MKIGDKYLLSCGHEGEIVWISADGEAMAVKASETAELCCNTPRLVGEWNPKIFLVSTHYRVNQNQMESSHLTTLVNRFLKTLKNMKTWNHLDKLRGESQLRHYLSNIIEYTYQIHRPQITGQEIEKLTRKLEGGEPHHG